MSNHNKSGKTEKSGYDMATTSLSKDNERYWMQKVFRHKRASGRGIITEDPAYSVRISYKGRRKAFQLDTANKKTAAVKARDIYRNLVANGWAGTTDEKSAVKTETTIGDVIRVFSEHTTASSKTSAEYIRLLRKVVASINKLTGDKNRFDHVNGGSAKWHAKIDNVLLSDITAAKVNKWRLAFVKKRGTDPEKEKSAKISANTYLTGCRSIFGAKVIDYLRAELNLPDKIAFDEVEKFPRPSMKYKSAFDVMDLMRKAQKELPGIEQDQQWLIFTLAVSTGMRRNEIDKLTWKQIDFEKNQIDLSETKYFKPKAENSGTDVSIDQDISDLLRGYYEQYKSAGEFVIQSDVLPILKSAAPKYRANRHHQVLIKWLRENGVTGNKPIHTLRKEVGSIITEKEGLYAASSFLRHSDIQVTAAHYVDNRKPITSGLGAILAGKEPK